MKTKEEILMRKVGKKYYDNNAITTNEALEAMQEYADQESERDAVEFAEWLRLPEYRNDYTNELISTSEIYKIFKQQKE